MGREDPVAGSQAGDLFRNSFGHSRRHRHGPRHPSSAPTLLRPHVQHVVVKSMSAFVRWKFTRPQARVEADCERRRKGSRAAAMICSACSRVQQGCGLNFGFASRRLPPAIGSPATSRRVSEPHELPQDHRLGVAGFFGRSAPLPLSAICVPEHMSSPSIVSNGERGRGP